MLLAVLTILLLAGSTTGLSIQNAVSYMPIAVRVKFVIYTVVIVLKMC